MMTAAADDAAITANATANPVGADDPADEGYPQRRTESAISPACRDHAVGPF
jgi:hypothetical protein